MNSTVLAAGNGLWLPHAMGEVLWGGLAFVIVCGVIAKFGGPAIKKASLERTAKITAELQAADVAKAEAEAATAAVKAKLADAEAESARIVTEAQATAQKVKADLIAKGTAEAAAIRERGAAEVASMANQGTADVSAELRRLAVGAAERIVAESLDDTTQQQLIDAYIGQVAASRN